MFYTLLARAVLVGAASGTYLGNIQVAREQSPVDVCSIADIRVVVFYSSLLQHLLHKVLAVAWLLQKQLDNGCQYLQLSLVSHQFTSLTSATGSYLSKFFHEAFHKALQNFTGIANLLSVLSDDPDQRSTSFRLVQFVNVVAERGDNALETGVLAQNVLDDNHRLLHNIVDPCRDEVLQSLHALGAGILNLDGNLTDSLDGSADKVHINFQCVFLEFGEKLLVVLLVCYPDHNFELLEFDVGRIVVFTEKDAELFAENIRLRLEQEVNVSKSNILDFGRRGNKSNCISLAFEEASTVSAHT